jgi:DNA-directed RNA polymerase specialized sigma24 family protein
MEARLLERINKTDTCWLWTAGVKQNGYAQLTIKNKSYAIHRVAYELWKGKIPDGHVIRHQCRNRHCVNPDHLETGTSSENAMDKHRDRTIIKGSKHHLARLTEDDAAHIRILRGFGFTYKELCDMYDVSMTTIASVITNRTWTT